MLRGHTLPKEIQDRHILRIKSVDRLILRGLETDISRDKHLLGKCSEDDFHWDSRQTSCENKIRKQTHLLRKRQTSHENKIGGHTLPLEISDRHLMRIISVDRTHPEKIRDRHLKQQTSYGRLETDMSWEQNPMTDYIPEGKFNRILQCLWGD